MCQVEVNGLEGSTPRLFLFDEQAGTWAPVPPSPSGEQSLVVGSLRCYAWDGEFYFPVETGPNSAALRCVRPGIDELAYGRDATRDLVGAFVIPHW